MSTIARIGSTLLLLVPVLVSLPSARAQELRERLYYDAPDENGVLSGGSVFVSAFGRDELLAGRVRARSVEALRENGPVTNRIDLVCVGDGYLDTELGAYRGHVDAAVDALFATEPFATYASFFNVHVVDVTSNESGVDNDPVEGIERDTAMDMGFWCSGIERLLCIDVSAAYGYALNAPDVDQILALANSVKYGGAGYTGSELATASGGNAQSTEVAIHEFGHSLGNLADEYGTGGLYTGPEPSAPNASIFQAAEMAAQGVKWADWLGDPGVGFGGVVNTFDGAMQYSHGIYRPTLNSKMRTLGRPFNLPSVEALITEFYRTVRPIDSATEADTVDTGDVVVVRPARPTGHALAVQWTLDGVPIADATADSLVLAELPLAAGWYELGVVVVDETPWVRDEIVRSTLMTDTRSWTLRVEEATAVLPGSVVPSIVALEPVANPAVAFATFRLRLGASAVVDADVFDLRGRFVRRLLAGRAYPTGDHTLRWDRCDARGRRAAAGVYLVRVVTPAETVVARVTMID